MRISWLSAAVAAAVLFSPFAMAQVRFDGALVCDAGLPSDICEKDRNVDTDFAIDVPIPDIAGKAPVAPSY